MKQKVTVPSVGESITTGIIGAWLKNGGDDVQEGDDLYELETDKATIAVPSPASGTLEILVKEGDEVSIGQHVATLTVKDDAERTETPEIPVSPAPAAAPKKKKKAQPEQKASAPPKPASAPPAPAPAPLPPSGDRPQERVPMTLIRKKTAERLLQAKHNAAHLTTFNEIDMEKIIELRTHYKEEFEQEHGIKIGFMSFFVKACCLALKEHPEVNTFVDGNDIIYNRFYDIGIAISIDGGLIVPVIRNADTLHFAEIESTIASFAQRAKDKTLTPDDLAGGTFTITNGGIFGSLFSTPVPAWPQSAILGMHAIKKRPLVVDDQIVIRPVMYVALTYDHRVIDGREAVGFLSRIKDFIEEPDKLLLEM